MKIMKSRIGKVFGIVVLLLITSVAVFAGGEFVPQINARQLKVKDKATFDGAAVSFTNATVTGFEVSSLEGDSLVVDGETLTTTISELNQLDGLTGLSATELNQLDGLTGVSGSELSHLSYGLGVGATTSAGFTLADGATLIYGYTIPASTIGARDSLDVKCYGLTAGANESVTASISLAGSTVCQPVSVNTTAGVWEIAGNILFTSATAQKAGCSFHTNGDASPNIAYGTGVLNAANALKLRVRIASGHGSDTVTAYYCTVTHTKSP